MGRKSIDLLPGQLELAGEVTLDGPGHDLLTIDAQEQSRIFAVLGGGVPEFDVAIEGLTLTRGKSTSVGSAIFFNSSRTLTLTNVVVSDSSTTGSNAGGDGIYVGVGSVDGNFVGGAVTLLNSTVSGNHTEGSSC